MKQFMDDQFLLETKTAETLYHACAKTLPIIDYHCHINPKDIAENQMFENITTLWLGHDHYKWRLMRSFGIEETYITGCANDKDKFIKWAEVLSKAIGNPLYHWSHLELQRYFSFYEPLTVQNAEAVWNRCNEMLKNPSMCARELIKQSNVEVICTTDDPIDTLMYHKQIAADNEFHVRVLPTFRPDRAINMEDASYIDYIHQLSEVSSIPITTFHHLKKALQNRMDYFASVGCKLSDHGLSYVMYAPASEAVIERIFTARIQGIYPTPEEALQFKTALMLFVCKEYAKRNWVLQLHYGCNRNNNEKQFSSLGADTGFDCISTDTPCTQLIAFLNALDAEDALPKTILYSLNPNDNQAIGTIIGCFQDSSAVAKIQHGSAWWFNDHKLGITEQLTSLASLGNLSGFVGMLTDSRSLLSYTRHEYFRRILCNQIGLWVENGEYPNDPELLFQIVSDICYYNATRYFDF